VAEKVKALHAQQHAGHAKVFIIVAVAAVLMASGGFGAYSLFGSKSSSSSSSGGHATNAASSGTTPTTQGIAISVQPPDGATAVAPGTVITVAAMTGHLTGVTVTGSDGSTIAGAMSADTMSWQSTGMVVLKTDYTVTADAAMADGSKSTVHETHFDSLVPAVTLGYTIAPASGLTVGVGEPVVLHFNHPVSAANQTAILADMHVTESMPVATGWYWFGNDELHLRPEVYWPTGEQVGVTADLNQFDAGNGMWATSNASTTFTVGPAHISTANITTDEMTVTSNGAVVATYPISAGRSIYPTMDGVHIDLYRQQKVHMVSSSVGIPVNSPNGYDENVFWTVNISDGGEFVHAAPWSVGSQGHANVSHGCINISTANAMSFFNFSRVGDIIDVTGSPRSPSLTDHGTMDWTEPWANWTPATVTTPDGAVAPVTTTTVPATPSTTAPAVTTTTAPVATVPTVPVTAVPATTSTSSTTSTTAPALAAYTPPGA
jgi:lipoprotein-anchoring transpeptidase ErfK/SrfK